MGSTSTTTNNDERKNIITEERSHQICQHMNEDHATSVYAMALSSIPISQRRTTKLQNVKMKSVSMTQYIVSFVVCNGDLCMPQTNTIPFLPPLSSPSEIRLRIVEDHHKFLTPNALMLFLDPLCFIILSICILLGYGTAYIGLDAMTLYFQDNVLVQTIFGSSNSFAYCVQYVFYLSVFLHGVEAMYVFYLCSMVLKLKLFNRLKWSFLVCCTGYPITKQVLVLVEVGNKKKFL